MNREVKCDKCEDRSHPDGGKEDERQDEREKQQKNPWQEDEIEFERSSSYRCVIHTMFMHDGITQHPMKHSTND